MTGASVFRIPGAEALTLDHAYMAMAWLGEEIADGRPMTDDRRGGALPPPRRRCSASCRSHSSTPPRSTSRAGAAPRSGQRGSPRIIRPQLHQVVLGIVLDGARPADRLLPVARQHRRRDARCCRWSSACATRFGIGRVCVVADRGMISAATMAGAGGAGHRLHPRRARALDRGGPHRRSSRTTAWRCRSPSRARRARPSSPSRR